MKAVVINALVIPVAMTALAAGWCVFMPLLMRLSDRLDGFSPALTGWGARV